MSSVGYTRYSRPEEFGPKGISGLVRNAFSIPVSLNRTQIIDLVS